jgi:hypothetical protein
MKGLRLATTPWAEFSGVAATPLVKGLTTAPNLAILPRLIGNLKVSSLWNSVPPRMTFQSLERDGLHWDLPLPTSGGQASHTFTESGVLGEVHFANRRSRAKADDRGLDSRERWLVWQLQRYAELAEFHEGGPDVDCLEASTRLGARRSWASVEKYWRMGGEESAELALVVRLALNEKLIEAIKKIERGPRRMLNRRYESQKLSRIQEMDSATLRKLAQAPGLSLAQKAGSRQELVAVVRRDTVDLQENRILLWIARRAKRMAASYCDRNLNFVGTIRYQAVRRFLRLCNQVLESPQFEDVAKLQHHLTSPTYCLQYDTKYIQVWRAYMLIRKQDRLEDDAWTWQAHLWGTTARLLAGAMLMNMEGWSELGESTPFFLTHSDCGEWTHGPSTPGPFQTPYGRCEILDLRFEADCFFSQTQNFPTAILESGADWALVWRDLKRVVLLWAAVSAGPPNKERPELATGDLRKRLKDEFYQSGWTLGGILLVAEPEIESGVVDSFTIDPQLIAIKVPVDVNQAWSDIKTCLQLGLEEFHAR